MYKLTDTRLSKAMPILDKYKNQLSREKNFDTSTFEKEIQECWNVGYQSLKGIICDMQNVEEYQYIAIYYMEYSNSTGVVSEFQAPLARTYGIERSAARVDREQAKKRFWNEAFARMSASITEG